MEENCGNCEFEVHKIRYRDFRHAAIDIFRQEGGIAFARGFMPRMCMYVPSTALSWGTYEFLKSKLNRYWKD